MDLTHRFELPAKPMHLVDELIREVPLLDELTLDRRDSGAKRG